METIHESARDIPVMCRADVVVAGSGPAGVTAAVAAARNGANTVLVERYGYLGGMMTGSYVTALLGFHNGEKQIVRGLGEELAQRLDEAGGITRKRDTPADCTADAEFLKWFLIEWLEEAGVKIVLHTWAADTIVEDGACSGIIVEHKGGRQAIPAQVTVDATADGDLCHACGCEMTNDTHDISLIHRFEGIDREKAAAFAETEPETYRNLLERLTAQGGELPGANTRYYQGCSTVDVHDLTRIENQARKRAVRGLVFARRHLPGYENARLAWTAPQLGIRESRKIVGSYTLTEADLRNSRRFSDTIGRCGAHLSGYALYKVRGLEYDIPYRCLLPAAIEGVLAAGRCVSATHEAMNTLRLIVPCFLTGEAAGTAAALASDRETPPGAIDVAELQERMRGQNNNLG